MIQSLLLIQLFLMLSWVAIKIGTKNDVRFSHNRLILLGAVLLAVGIPFIPVSMNVSLPAAIPAIQLPTIELNQTATTVESTTGMTLMTYFKLFYVSGMLLSAIWFGLKLVSLLNIHRQSEHLRDNIRLTATNQPSFSFLNTVYLNPGDAESEAIISHEQAHIQRKHSIDILFFQVLKVVFWINPFVYLLEKNLKEFHEFEADESALKTVENRHSYAESLLSIARGEQRYVSLGSYFWNESMIKKRIHTMLTHNPNQTKTTMKYSILTLTLISMLGLAACTEKQTSVDAQTTAPEKKISSVDDLDMTEVFLVTEEMPKAVGGSLAEQLMKNIYYTDNAKDEGVEGRVIVQFIVDKEGDVETAFIPEGKGIHQELDDIAIHAVKQLEFDPAIQRGEPVKVLMTLPIVFKLPADESKS